MNPHILLLILTQNIWWPCSYICKHIPFNSDLPKCKPKVMKGLARSRINACCPTRFRSMARHNAVSSLLGVSAWFRVLTYIWCRRGGDCTERDAYNCHGNCRVNENRVPLWKVSDQLLIISRGAGASLLQQPEIRELEIFVGNAWSGVHPKW